MPNSFNITEAAAYIGVTVPQFRRAVDRHELPEPFIKCRPQRWSKAQLDMALEGRKEIAPSSATEKSDADKLRDAIDGRKAKVRHRAA